MEWRGEGAPPHAQCAPLLFVGQAALGLPSLFLGKHKGALRPPWQVG